MLMTILSILFYEHNIVLYELVFNGIVSINGFSCFSLRSVGGSLINEEV